MARRSSRLAGKQRKNLNEDVLAEAQWENKSTPLWSTALEQAQTRVDSIVTARKQKRAPVVPLTPISKESRHILFMNPGTDRIHDAVLAISRGEQRPAWCKYFRNLKVREASR